MVVTSLRMALVVVVVTLLSTGPAMALGFELGKTKEELKLKYDVAVSDHNTGRVTVVFTLEDEGSLEPINSVDFCVPAKDGSGYYDLSVSIEMKEENGKKVGRVHIAKDLAERAQIHLKTSHLDGKRGVMEWYYHAIPVAKSMKAQKKG